MKTHLIHSIPPSQAGQVLRERLAPGKKIIREIIEMCKDPKKLVFPGSTVWTARHGGWVKLV